MTTPLEGKVALVTGGARGIGRGLSHRLARLGASVAVLDLSMTSYKEFAGEQELMTSDSTVSEIVEAGGRAIGIEVDVTDRAAMASAVARVRDTWGRLDIAVCNAGGGSGPAGAAPAHEIDEATFRAVLDRNLMGTVNTAQPAAKLMIEQGGGGRIVTLSSTAGIHAYDPTGGYADYGSAKAAIAMYTRYLANALGRYGIRVNAIAPGYTGTARLNENFEKMGVEKITAGIPLQRIGTVDDIAGVLEFLVTDLSAYVSGQVIAADGGVSVFAK
ncbi:SDR family NAD(P)-dependent oxidoreductase [Nocardia nova]|uniref:SDR family NAD(P)-dependent oxidoreductase n=1 Tax=Nocardia nova TaxID=37330 RepID=UPI0033DCCA8D